MTSTQVKMLLMLPVVHSGFAQNKNAKYTSHLVPTDKLGCWKNCLMINIPCHSVCIFFSTALRALCWYEQQAELRTLLFIAHVSIWCIWTLFFFFMILFVDFFLCYSWACSPFFLGGGVHILQVGLMNTPRLVDALFISFHEQISVYCWPNSFFI